MRPVRFHTGLFVALLLMSAVPGMRPVLAADDVAEPGAGVFLVARRGMPDPRFAQTVVLLVEYGTEGALGVIVNRPTRLPLPEAFPDLPALKESDQHLWFGGPVQPDQAALLVSTPQAPERSLTVLDQLHFSTSIELLHSLARSPAPTRFRVYAGYAGWAPAQLDGELARGDWLLRGASAEQVMTGDARGLWQELIDGKGTWVKRERGGGGEWPPRLLAWTTRRP